MSEGKLKVVVCGLGDWGRKTLSALSTVPGMDLLGVGDINAGAAQDSGLDGSIPFFTDQRHMIQQLKPDAVILTSPPAAAAELTRLAVKVEADIIRAAPPARSLDEAVELTSMLRNRKRRMEILQPRLYMASYRRMLESLQLCGGIFLARCDFLFNWGGGLNWRADRTTAGGGVLLEAGFQLLDLVIRALGLPEEVYAVTGRQGRPHMLETAEGVEAQGIYDTDDSAVVSLRYPSGAAASLVCSWATAPAVERITLHGRQAVLQADPEQFALFSPDGIRQDAVDTDGLAVTAIAAQLRDITRRWIPGEPEDQDARPCRDLPKSCYLAAMAVLEAAYLSDRTGQNESPWRLLEARGIDPTSTLASSRPDADPGEDVESHRQGG